MDNKFIAYRKKNKNELNQLWKEAYFTFDTNFLLNLYRYSDSSKRDLFDLMKSLNGRFFLTYQVAYEYNKNRYETINEVIKSNNDFLKNISKIKSELLSTNGTPYLSTKLSLKFNNVITDIEKEINNNIIEYQKYFNEDFIHNKIVELFNNKILEGFDKEKIKAIEKEGQFRYENKIPPGFSDSKKESNKYGDLIIWKEIIESSKIYNVPIIFITDDKKEDWIWKLKDDKTIGPRPELIQEFIEKTNKLFHIHNTNSFIKTGSEYFNENIDGNTLDEIDKVNSNNELKEYYQYLKTLDENIIESKLQILTPREADLLRLYIGFGNYTKFTLNEIAEIFDVSLSRVIQLRNTAIKKLLNSENKL